MAVSGSPGESSTPTEPKQTQTAEAKCFRRCDGCFTDRACYEYEGLWLCKGPQRCWSKRKVMNKKTTRRSSRRAS